MRSYIAVLKEHEELLEIDKEVDPLSELAGLAWQAENNLKKAVLFNNLKGYPGWKAVSYIHGSRKRIAMGLGISEKNYIRELTVRLQKKITPKLLSDGPVKEVVWTGEQADLRKIPVHVHSTCDPSPYLGHICIAKDPETGIRNVSIHRCQVKGRNKTGILMHPGRHLDMIYKKYERMGKAMPIAIVIGHHPAYYLAACWTTAFGVDEFEIAGALMNEPAELVKCETIDLEVPAYSEIVIEGEVPPHIREEEGPFGEHHGLCHGGKGLNPIINIKAITMRHDAIYYALQGGRPIAESQILDAIPQEVTLYERLKDVLGYVDLRDIVIPPYAGGSHIVIIQMVPEVEGQVRTVLMAALSSPYRHMKIAIAVDEDIDPNDPRDLWWSISTRVNPQRDIFIIPDVLGHSLDVSLEKIDHGLFLGSKMGIDATKGPKRCPEQRALFDRIAPKGLDKVNIQNYLGHS
ncbi:MAG: UbiD family decarboxylase [Candidatus Bathyarchaeia archaeon]